MASNKKAKQSSISSFFSPKVNAKNSSNFDVLREDIPAATLARPSEKSPYKPDPDSENSAVISCKTEHPDASISEGKNGSESVSSPGGHGSWKVSRKPRSKRAGDSGTKSDAASIARVSHVVRQSKCRGRKMVVESPAESEADEGSEDEDWVASAEIKSGKVAAMEEDSELGSELETETDLESEGEEVPVVKTSNKKVVKGKFAQKAPRNGVKKEAKAAVESKQDTEVKLGNNKEASGEVMGGDSSDRFGGRVQEKFPFLVKNRRDAKRRAPGDAGYDPKTLHVPESFFKDLSAGQKQWWQFKAQHMDKVLFFKMGKFYELFEMDAHIGAKELDLQYMKGDQPHCGFPEKNYADNAERLVRKGFRVLVVEQTETPDQLERRRKETGAKDKVVRRDICAVLTKGTLTDGDMLASSPEASFLLSLTESASSSEESVSVGVCALDAASGRFLVGQFVDDSGRTRLCSILSELRPVEIVRPRGGLSEASGRALRDNTRSPLVNEVDAGWEASSAMEILHCFFNQNEGQEDGAPSRQHWPAVLRQLVELGPSGCLALGALGGCLSYLGEVLLDRSLLSLRRVEILPGTDIPVGTLQEPSSSFCSSSRTGWQEVSDSEPRMVLDASVLENLDILENSVDGGREGTLYALLDHCVTPFGKRLLRQWLVRPLVRTQAIQDRQMAVRDLKGPAAEALVSARKAMAGLPDMERLLARLHSGSGGRGRHAGNVVLYEDAAMKHLKEFTSALRGCQALLHVATLFQPWLPSLSSQRLSKMLTIGDGFPEIAQEISRMEAAFDWVKAEETGRIIPSLGVDSHFDRIADRQRAVEGQLEEYLQEQRKLLGNPPEMVYVTVGKDPYQMELSEKLHTKVPKEYELKTSRKGFRRYWTPRIKKLLSDMTAVREERELALKSILATLRSSFCSKINLWSAAVSSIAELDVLASLSLASQFSDTPSCCPQLIPCQPGASSSPYVQLKGLVHPILVSSSRNGALFVPNDTVLGGADSAPFLVLSGPNMGGKSTQLRQVCLAVIMAQIGAEVAAESMTFTPFDRLFVRMGAKDRIMAGQSTFLVELCETATMLKSATRNSLVVLDELGRGTATSDGQAIAHAVLCHLAHSVGCLGMFSTHYHRLVDDFSNDPKVALQHMACKVEKGTDGVEEVTFLYKLASGSCPKSYGVNVARLAGMPEEVILRASTKAAEMEADEVAARSQSGKNPDMHCEDVKRLIASLSDVLGKKRKFANESGMECKYDKVIKIWEEVNS